MTPRSIFRSRRRRVIAAALAIPPGRVVHAEVAHKVDCPRPRGGRCVCRPCEVEVAFRQIYPDPTRN